MERSLVSHTSWGQLHKMSQDDGLENVEHYYLQTVMVDPE